MGPHTIDKVRAILAIRSHAPKRVVRVKAIICAQAPLFARITLQLLTVRCSHSSDRTSARINGWIR